MSKEIEEFRESILKGLNKYELYEELNKNVDTHLYSNYCEDIIRLFPKNTDIDKLCYRFAKNLVTLRSMLKYEDDSERCKYFTFWIHNQIKKNTDLYGLNSLPEKFFYLQFFQVESEIKGEGKNNDCFYEYIPEVGIDLWIKWKDLYDYIKNYDDIKDKINSDAKLCKIYNNYYNYIKDTYTNFKKECCNGSREKCPNNLKFNEWCDKNYILTKLVCDDSEEVVKRALEHRIDDVAQQGGDDALVEKQGDKYGILEAGTTGSPKSEEREERGSTGPQRETGAGTLTDSYNLVASPIGEASESVMPPRAGTIGATLAESSLFLLMMYKYTPLGSWVSTKILRRNKLMENMEKNYDLLLNDVRNHEASLNSPMYHISYNSATNH